MSGSFSRSFLKVERSLVFRPARVPNTFPRVPGIDGSPAAILYELSDERTLSPWRDKLPFATSRQTLRVRLAKVNVQAQATVPGSAVLIQRRRLPVACGSYGDVARLPSKARRMAQPPRSSGRLERHLFPAPSPCRLQPCRRAGRKSLGARPRRTARAETRQP